MNDIEKDIQAMIEAGIGGDDSVTPEQREAIYAAWALYRDDEEKRGDRADICDFRAGFQIAWELQATTLRDTRDKLAAVVEFYGDETRWDVPVCNDILHNHRGHLCSKYKTQLNYTQGHGYDKARATLKDIQG